MKKLYIIALTLIAFTSCNKALDEELTGDLTADGVIVNEQGINFALNGAYSTMTSFIGNTGQIEKGWTLIEFGTDTYTNASDGNFKSFNNYNTDLNSTSPIVTDTWNIFYRGINSANAVIGRVEGALPNQPDKVKNIMGQARFLRGFYYFWLARIWGPVPYNDKEIIGAQTEFTRMPLNELYPKIIEDLKFAADNLPGQQPQFGRATSWAAKAALADVYLNIKDYDMAAQYAEDIITNGPFKLVKPFSDLWKIGNEQNSEVIISAQFSNDLLTDNGGNPAHMFFLMEYDRLPGMQRDVANGRPFKRFRPTDYLLNLYDMNDQRYDGTFTTVWYANNPATLPPGVKIGDTAVYLPRRTFTQAEKNAKPYGKSIYNQNEYTEKIYPSSKKWIQPNRLSVNEQSGDRDFILYRLAEIYLIAAEANALKAAPDQAKALQYLNEVRMRAYGVTNISTLPVITSVDINVILEERAKEFAQEGKRWFDLTRTGKLVERVKLYNPQGAANIQPFHALRPIPLTQIDRTSNEFPQNPGY